MKIKKIFIILAWVVACILALLIITGYILFVWAYRPLHVAGKWRVVAESFEGVPLAVKTYQMLGRPEPLFICVQIPREMAGSPQPRFYDGGDPNDENATRDLPLSHAITKAPQRWFMVFTSGDEPRAAAINPPETLPYFHFDSTNPYGRLEIDINSPWLGETWSLTRKEGVVVLSNELFSISVSNKKDIK